MCPNYEYICNVCDSTTVENHPMANRPEKVSCVCGGEAAYMISMPHRPFKEALLDGTKRKGFSELKEANKLHRLKDGTRDKEDRARIASEITRLGGDGIRKKGE